MKIIHSNSASNVGIVTDPTNLHEIGDFSVARLKEWVKWLEDMYGAEQVVHLLVRKSDDSDAFVIAATSNGENPFVMVCGRYNTDGTTWEKPLC